MPADLLYVPRARIGELWPVLAPFIASALAHSDGEYLAEDLRDLALEGKTQLWGVVDCEVVGAGATQVLNFPRKKILQLVCLGGYNFDAWAQQAWQEIERFAYAEGCDRARIFGRAGWVKKAGRFGFRPRYHVLTKVLP